VALKEKAIEGNPRFVSC